MLSTPKTPFRITSDVRNFVSTIKQNPDPLYVRVEAAPWAQVNECFVNVKRKVERDRGRAQYGWAIWQCEQYFIEAEHHCVHDDGSELLDITPHEPRVERIMFLPDDSAVYDFDTTNQRDNIRMALVNDPRVHKLLELFSERTALVNTVPAIGGTVSLEGEAAQRLISIQKQLASLENALSETQKINIWKT